jgi:hypothetical protein
MHASSASVSSCCSACLAISRCDPRQMLWASACSVYCLQEASVAYMADMMSRQWRRSLASHLYTVTQPWPNRNLAHETTQLLEQCAGRWGLPLPPAPEATPAAPTQVCSCALWPGLGFTCLRVCMQTLMRLHTRTHLSVCYPAPITLPACMCMLCPCCFQFMLYACMARGWDIAGVPQSDNMQHAHVHPSTRCASI